jgi:hypothetical protein
MTAVEMVNVAKMEFVNAEVCTIFNIIDGYFNEDCSVTKC